ncbi:MAG: hypothetical protein ACRDGW_10235, partial [Actinomycetota bacterium]
MGVARVARQLPLEGLRLRAAAAQLGALLLAVAAGGALMLLAGGEPVSAYAALIEGAFGSPFGIGQVLVLTVPFVIIGLGLALAFRGRVYN